MKIQEIKTILNNQPSEEFLQELALDQRSGVQKLLQGYYKKLAATEAEKQRFQEMLRYEKQEYLEGAKYVAGVDEAGRGPLAGPLVVAAVILPQEVFISGLNDSKQLSAKKRELLYTEILNKAVDISVNIVSVSNIDDLNIYRATQEGMCQVLQHLQIKPQTALIDAMPLEIENMKCLSVVHGDALSASIAAASIIAKVTRDRIMERLADYYPQYGFAGNKGYGSKEHMQALSAYGATRWHRRSFEPVKSMMLPAAEKTENILYLPLKDNYKYEPEG